MAARKKEGKSKKRGAKPEEAEPQEESVSRPVARFFTTTLITLVVLYAATLVISRTDGCRAFVAEKLGDRLGLSLSIGKLWADWQLNVHAEDLETEGFGEYGEPGVRVAAASVRWCWSGVISPKRTAIDLIDIDGCDITFAPTKQGVWLPRPLSGVARWLAQQLQIDLGDDEYLSGQSDLSDKSDGPDRVRDRLMKRFERTAFRLERASGVWWGWNDEELARVNGLNVTATPISVPTRRMLHMHITGERVWSQHGAVDRSVQLEFLYSGDEIFLLRMKADPHSVGRRGAVTPAGVPVPAAGAARQSRGVPAPSDDADFRAYVRDALEEAMGE